jgi:hypothetical protein
MLGPSRRVARRTARRTLAAAPVAAAAAAPRPTDAWGGGRHDQVARPRPSDAPPWTIEDTGLGA